MAGMNRGASKKQFKEVKTNEQENQLSDVTFADLPVGIDRACGGPGAGD